MVEKSQCKGFSWAECCLKLCLMPSLTYYLFQYNFFLQWVLKSIYTYNWKCLIGRSALKRICGRFLQSMCFCLHNCSCIWSTKAYRRAIILGSFLTLRQLFFKDQTLHLLLRQVLWHRFMHSTQPQHPYSTHKPPSLSVLISERINFFFQKKWLNHPTDLWLSIVHSPL